MKNNVIGKICTAILLAILCIPTQAQFVGLDVVTLADSNLYMFNPKPDKSQGLHPRVAGLSCGPMYGGYMLQQYVPQDTVIVYGVALTMRNTLRNGSFDSIHQTYRAVLMQRANGMPDQYGVIRPLEHVDSITLNPANIKQCLFRYDWDLSASYANLPCVEFYFNKPKKINQMTDTFYVGRMYFDESDTVFYPSEFSGLYNTDPRTCEFWSLGYADTTCFYKRSERYWGFAFPIIGFRCKPLDEVYHSLLLTDVTNDGATVHWYSAEEGTTYNVRLTSADGSVDSVVITTDSSYTFHSLPYNKRYKIQVRKQCHYATYNYDTTVYSPWTTNTSTSTFTLGVDTTSSGIDTTGGGGGGGGIDTTSTGIVMVGNNVFTLNPNPVHGVVEVTLTQPLATNATLTLYDLGGREVRRQFLPAGSQHASFDTEGCPTGTYILKLLTPQGVASRRLVVN